VREAAAVDTAVSAVTSSGARAAAAAGSAPIETLAAVGFGLLLILLLVGWHRWRHARQGPEARSRRRRALEERIRAKREYRQERERLRPLEDAVARGVRRGRSGW
jgi:hypothetical protein